MKDRIQSIADAQLIWATRRVVFKRRQEKDQALASAETPGEAYRAYGDFTADLVRLGTDAFMSLMGDSPSPQVVEKTVAYVWAAAKLSDRIFHRTQDTRARDAAQVLLRTAGEVRRRTAQIR